jgi:hypothetical protein
MGYSQRVVDLMKHVAAVDARSASGPKKLLKMLFG